MLLRWLSRYAQRRPKGRAPGQQNMSVHKPAPGLSEERLEVSDEPDLPQPFGYKVGWFAVSTNDAALVARVLGLIDVKVANWETGMKVALHRAPSSDEPRRTVFLTPPLDGWVLVVAAGLPYPTELSGTDKSFDAIPRRFNSLVLRLASRFDDVQHFASHRVSGFASWTRCTGGVYRSFSFGDGWVFLNRGSQSKEERDLGLPDLTGMCQQAATAEIFRLVEVQSEQEAAWRQKGLSHKDASLRVGRSAIPGEDDVTDLAGLWSLDPSRLDEKFQQKSTGLIGVVYLDG